ncbi:MAG: hypothetical protein GKC10_03535 [Methanosarcinales archaeon]|nr:hypothetical protein [Methanosarcinales archaeon]
MVVFALMSSASAYYGGNTIKQSITMTGTGGDISQSASNAAVVVGNNNNVDQSISQTASGNHITQSAANAAVVFGNNNDVNQGINQRATGNTIGQASANAVAVVGDFNTVGQSINQRAIGQEIYQSGWNTGTIIGNGNTLDQSVNAFASTYTPPAVPPADPSQTMSNTAYIMGVYNQVNQGITGIVMTGGSNAPVYQSANNLIETRDMYRNSYEQGIMINVRAGPLAYVEQSGSNEIRLGPW